MIANKLFNWYLLSSIMVSSGFTRNLISRSFTNLTNISINSAAVSLSPPEVLGRLSASIAVIELATSPLPLVTPPDDDDDPKEDSSVAPFNVTLLSLEEDEDEEPEEAAAAAAATAAFTTASTTIFEPMPCADE